MVNKINIEDCCFHDCYIHGVSFDAVKEINMGEEELHFDIDYIVGWPDCADETTKDHFFNVSRATLKFKNVGNVKVNLNEQQFIDWIEYGDDPDISMGARNTKWIIHSGRSDEPIAELNASEAVLELSGKLHLIKMRQYLTSEEREQ